MKNKFTYILIASLFIPQILQAQPSQANPLSGVVIYHQKIQLRPNVGVVIKNDMLKYNRTKSIFQWHMFHSIQFALNRAARKHPEKSAQIKKARQKLKGRKFKGAQTNLVSITKDSIYSQRYLRFLGKWIYYKEKRPAINWQFSDSTKKIGNYKVEKATAHFRGRDYTAWYTPKIPVPYGPWKLGGLPGLIIQAYDSSGNFYFSAQKISFTDIPSIGPIHLNSNVQHISFAEYKKMMNHFNEDLRKRISKAVRMMQAAVRKGVISQKKVNKVKRKIRSKLPTVHPLETFSGSSGD